ncbi:MAG: DUF4118 domain-containing protein [Gemmatimonadota bacterium]
MTGRDARPDPDELLRLARQEEAAAHRGRLKIFFGASPGVGKTYAMLEEARTRRLEGVDVVVGVVETHGRPETEALLAGLEVLPRRPIDYRGVTLLEFDLDGALARRPALILVDELAHTNAPGSRHAKRWQDIEELLAAGIDVYSTLNVQHLESLNDVVAQITGIQVRETVPDSILETADQVELADLSPDDLLRRLEQGKVYVPDQARRAIDRFFRKGNLIALRELALRRTAERVDAQMRGYMREQGIREIWPAGDRVLICVGPNPESARLVRAAKRMAMGLKCEWVAVYVETPAHACLSAAEKEALLENMQLAEELGGLAVTLSGLNPTDEILAYARRHNITRIIVGKPTHPRWRDKLFGSLLDGLVRGSGDIDVYVISGDERAQAPRRLPPPPSRATASQYGWAALAILLCTALNWLVFRRINVTDVAMIYLLGIVATAARTGRGPAVFAALASVALLDFLFVPPLFTFHVADLDYTATFVVMFAVSLVISYLTLRVREQARESREREQRMTALYAMSRELAATSGADRMAAVARRHVSDALACQAAIFLPAPEGRLAVVGDQTGLPVLDDRELAVARWVFDHGKEAGAGTDTLPASRGLYLALRGSTGVVGVLGIVVVDPRELLYPARRRLLEAFASQIALALERSIMAARSQQTQIEVEAERLRTSLLSSLSHDLRTPLGAIMGAATSLRGDGGDLDAVARADLIETILEEAARMNRLVGNLLDMIRLESGALSVQPDWQSLEEVVGVALIRLDERLKGRNVSVHLPEELPLVALDGILIEQVLVNLLDNALKYSPPGSPIEVNAEVAQSQVIVSVADRGPGVPPGAESRIFDKFYRVEEGSAAGVGLGLTICRGIVVAHGGRIWAENRPGGGLAVRFTLPVTEPPALPEPEDEPATAAG